MGLEEEMRRLNQVLVATFDECYQMAKKEKYLVVGKTFKGIRLNHIFDKNLHATITEVDKRDECAENKMWELVLYNYYPEDEEPFTPRI